MTGRMPRWLIWAPVGLLILGVGLFYLRLGVVAATLSETDVINRYAGQYVASRQAADPASPARLTDCHAVPSDEPGVWLIVICGQGGCGPGYAEYHVSRLGGFVHGGDTACPDAAVRRALA